METKLTITFDNPQAAEHFQSWLCGQGEQDYWMWMECREQEEDGNITALNFDYDFHHLDPNQKDFSIGKQSKSFAVIRSELDKCVLLCSNCHRKRHK